MNMRRTMAATFLLAVVGNGIAVATPGSGVTSVTLGTATFDRKLEIRQPVSADAQVAQVTLAPFGHTGWHSHLGPEVVLVQSGSITVRATHTSDPRRCGVTNYTAGQGFVIPPSHTFIVSNPSGDTEAMFIAAFFDIPHGSPSNRIDRPDPGVCPPA